MKAGGRMTLDDVLADMRSRGMPIGKKSLCDGMRGGMFPFAKVLSIGPTGRTTHLILRPAYEEWAEANIGPVIK